jgi:hypothetical protein
MTEDTGTEFQLKLTITFGMGTTPPGMTREDAVECVMHGLISLRDNSVEIASVEDYETGEQHAITINDFTMEE